MGWAAIGGFMAAGRRHRFDVEVSMLLAIRGEEVGWPQYGLLMALI